MNQNQHGLPENLQKEIQSILFSLKGLNYFDNSAFLGLYLLSIQFNGSIVTREENDIKIDHSRELKKIDNSLHEFFEALIHKNNPDQILNLSGLVHYLIQKSTKNVLISVFNEILHRIIEWHGKGQGNSLQTPGLIKLMLDLANVDHNAKLYNPFCGFGEALNILETGQNYCGQEINKRDFFIAVLHSVLQENESSKIHFFNSDPLKEWNPLNEKFNCIIAVPPFNMRTEMSQWGSRADVQFFRRAIESLDNQGKVVVLLPLSFLFASDKESVSLKEDLAHHDLIELVLELPSDVLRNTSVKSCIVVLSNSKQRKGEVRFIDGTSLIYIGDKKNKECSPINFFYEVMKSDDESVFDDFGNIVATRVANSVIKENEFNLTVQKYFVLEKGSQLPKSILSEVTEIIEAKRNRSESAGKLVGIGNLKKGLVDYVLQSSELKMIDIDPNARIINEDCILVANQFNQLKPTFFKFSGEPIYISPAIYALRIDKMKVDPFFLIHQLSTSVTEFQVRGLSVGSTIPIIAKKELLSIRIDLPDLEEQENKVTFLKEEYWLKNREAQECLNEIKQLQQIHKDELRIKKHRLNQDMNNVASSARTLLTHLKNKGNLQIDQIINPTTGTTVIKRFEAMLSSIQLVLQQIDDLPNEMKYYPAETIDIEELVSWAIEQRPHSEADRFQLDFYVDKESFKYGEKDEEFITPYVDFSRNDFLELYTNILENAILHGFIEDKNYIFRIEIIGDIGGGRVIVLFGNNGSPFPVGMSERYSIKGEKAGDTAHEGIGSWKVWNIAEHFNSKIEVHDLPEEEFPVWIELIIPLKTNWDVQDIVD